MGLFAFNRMRKRLALKEEAKQEEVKPVAEETAVEPDVPTLKDEKAEAPKRGSNRRK